ncbi:fimbria/pilus periplasmic chaperone [Erwinia sp. HDF1-3R]|uniref:fimbria/pilus periplasmic chaperone n=1 Tax=Erwinia sp. HDF1-3R TaxID=3141543 RepID=UPI0031F51AC4
MKFFNINKMVGALFVYAMLYCTSVSAGIVLGGSRIVYSADARQTSISVKNDSGSASYLIQSWVEKEDGTRTTDFIITPPLYLSAPGNENILRVIYAGAPHASKNERLYYFNVKAVPSVDKTAIQNKNSVVVATTLKVKLFVRPAGLKPAREQAENELVFTRKGSLLDIHNPTPYWLTLTGIKTGGRKLEDVMISPQGRKSVSLPAGSGTTISWNAINDYGGVKKGKGRIR